MSRLSTASRIDGPNYPLNWWYVAAPSAGVGHHLLGRRLLGVPVVLYRTADGTVVGLRDRCAHRAFPLSRGTLDGDTLVCGFHGFSYDSTGSCIRVPSQAQVPIGAGVPAIPTVDDGNLVWAWVGDPARVGLHGVPELPWLADPAWTTCGGELRVEANYLLLHENFADVTHVPFVDPDIAPAALHSVAPPLEVEVTEQSVSFSRTYPASSLSGWHVEATGLPADGLYPQREAGGLVSPGLWVDLWEVTAPDPESAGNRSYCLRFTQAVTPTDPASSLLTWRVSRNFRLEHEGVTQLLERAFTQYYGRVGETLETVQANIAADGHGREVHVSADAAGLRVRRIVAAMLADESDRF
jgi:phenylpropionate dioxygenase-like ring-hydroxylating dioxygenase large terminal subunit